MQGNIMNIFTEEGNKNAVVESLEIDFATIDKDIEDSNIKSTEGDSVGTSDASGSDTEKRTKRRSWKKPKDKPKRPFSAYNFFFQYQRTRIVEGHGNEPATQNEIIRNLEDILSKTREKKRHKKSHGKIGFGDLARSIADAWKKIDPETKSIFNHYASLDMARYKREVKAWKEKKDQEEEETAIAKHAAFMSRMNRSSSSSSSLTALGAAGSSATTTLSEATAALGISGGSGYRAATDESGSNFNASFASVHSDGSEISYEPEGSSSEREHTTNMQQSRATSRGFMARDQQGFTAGHSNMIMQGSFSGVQQQQQQQHGRNNMMMGLAPSNRQQMMGMAQMKQQQQTMLQQHQQQMIAMQQRHQQQMMEMQRQQQQLRLQYEQPLQGSSSSPYAYDGWNSAAGQSSVSSLQLESLLGIPGNQGGGAGHASLSNQVSDYSSTTGGSISTSMMSSSQVDASNSNLNAFHNSSTSFHSRSSPTSMRFQHGDD